MDVSQEANAKAVIGVAKALNLGVNGALIGMMVALAESNLKNYASDAKVAYPGIEVSQQNPVWLALAEPRPLGRDQESVGIFQQRVTKGWSTIASGTDALKSKDAIWQLMNPLYAAQAFFGSPPGSNMPPAVSKGLQNIPGWQSMAPQLAAQAVQRSAFPDGRNYLVQSAAAQTLINKFYESTPAAKLVIPLGSGTGNPGAPGSGGPAKDCPGGISINCTPPEGVPDNADKTGGQIRSNIVCLAQSEYALWQEGKLRPGTDFHKYSQGRGEEWCADFASWIYNQAGIPLKPTNEGNVPAVRTVYEIGNNDSRFEYHPSNSGYTPRPGDLAIHSSAGNAFYHVNMVTAVAGGKVTIIGGNQSGTAFSNSKVSSYDMANFTAEDTIGYVGPKITPPKGAS